MSPRIKLAVAAHIDDSSIFFLSFFIACWACLRLDCGLLRRLLFFLYVPVIFLTLPLSVFCHLRFMHFFVSPLFSLFFPPFWLPASSPFFSPVFLSSRLFALSVFYPFSSFPLSSVSPPSCDSFYMRIIIQGRPGYSVTDDFTRSRALVMHPY